jgi:N-acetyl-gamma-glutamyl-phosphate reductase
MNIVIVGASGYSGAELAKLVSCHPSVELVGMYVSENSLDQGKLLPELYPQLRGMIDNSLTLTPLTEQSFVLIEQTADIICLCTDHAISAVLAPQFLAMGKKVFDLSGAFRLSNNCDYDTHYGFTHNDPYLLEQAAYGLAEWHSESIKKAQLIAVPGCYPTAALNALKPLKQAQLLADETIIINAVSGVSGAGRKANIATSFCEVSLSAYGLFNHRHSPEIETYLNHKILFTPHLGNFKRGILETIYVTLKPGVTPKQVDEAYQVLADEPLVRLLDDSLPSIKGVEYTPFVDIAWQQQGQQLIVMVAIDNLLKGASAQALQCINLSMGLPSHIGLLGANYE